MTEFLPGELISGDDILAAQYETDKHLIAVIEHHGLAWSFRVGDATERERKDILRELLAVFSRYEVQP